MALNTQTSADGSSLTISLPVRFDFKVHKELREAYETRDKRYANYVVDLSNTRYMDSSALGMLLQLREFAGDRADAVRIANVQESVREILRIANFHRLMTIN